MRALPACAVATLALAAPAEARVPYMDSGATCGPAAQATGDRLAVAFCLSDEARALGRLMPVWRNLPPPVRAHCLVAERRAGPGSYRSLAACVDARLAEAGLSILALPAD